MFGMDSSSISRYQLYAVAVAVMFVFVVLLCFRTKQGTVEMLLPNEHVGHLYGLARDALEDPSLEAKKWSCSVCSFRNAPDQLECVLCRTSQAVYLLVAPEFGSPDGSVVTVDKLNSTQRSARERHDWVRVYYSTRATPQWTTNRETLSSSQHYVATESTETFQLVELAPEMAGVAIASGAPIASWWFGQLEHLQSLSFSLKYAWLVTELSGLTEKHTKMKIFRAKVFQESIHVLMLISPDQLCTKTKITLLGESAIDAGGVTREWYTLLTTEIFSDEQGLFMVTNKDDQSFFINPNSERDHGPNHLADFQAVGRLLGRAIIDGQVLPFHFCVPLFKMLLGYPVSIEDIRYLDPTVYSSLTYIRDCDDVDDLALTFSVTVDTDVPEVELVVGGRDVGVTNANKAEYVERMVQYLMFERVAPQLQRLVQGLYDVLPQELLMPFDYKELELILCGFSEIDVGDWKRSTIVSKSLEDVVGWFWDVVEFDMTPSDRAKLLQFTTGSSRVPIQGFKGLTSYDGRLCPFSLHGTPYVKGAFPKVHSCFNRIDLPTYPSRELLREGLFVLVTIDTSEFTIA
ncbi:hypothetical protein H257_12871 [Aphanomyces astaci]|uniref:HECT-type E3 ubiquitin transferase n=1 Tax=Aphanomyces astaci TaxID=112090 RepID=W4FX75_APHAT|nr:hypothetical protein H257_12870 [Aphanomyces astaci]XP_009838530.1 hypothetical protein H257_12871 [Aphanomyces astaci]ETV72086.1 hypothetical protein H257_12870 [Aphanomyces astaci]ETV72087.1 hypothetical protein H257_12871 [Aphanomyces astaci]|eukprot:XP_009838529.1 hypothetical protein H257_12870 [Aphanomyces astaci]